MSPIFADVELSLRQTGLSTYLADLRFRTPTSNADTDLASAAPVHLSLGDLTVGDLDPAAYGAALTAMLFAAPRLREGWMKIKGFIEGTNHLLRIRLRLDSEAAELHAIHWETLCDPESGFSLCRSERMLLSRYLDTSTLSIVPILPRTAIRALAVVASPTDLEDFNLAVVDVAGEVGRARTALGDLPVTVIARYEAALAPSLSNLIDNLRAGHAILYLACHGTLRRGDPLLWLEQHDGSADCVSGATLVQRIADLPADRRPLLVVLAVCRSAGTGADAMLAALGPRLARIGVTAVIGMQGDVPMRTIERLLPRFFSLLRDDGAIDRALALARADLAEDEPWWMPALYMRSRDGRLWTTSDMPAQGTAAAHAYDTPKIESGMVALSRLLEISAIRGALASFRTDFETASAQVTRISDYKQLHDLFQQLEDVLNLCEGISRRLPADDVAWDEIAVNEPELRRLIAQLSTAASKASLAAETTPWLRRLERSRDALSLALGASDPVGLRRAIARLDEIIAQEPARVNTGLVNAARSLHLMNLAQALGQVCAHMRLHAFGATLPQVDIFAAGLEALEQLAARLNDLVQLHDHFQELDNELRRVRTLIDNDPEELTLTWGDLQSLIQQINCRNQPWSAGFADGFTAIDHTLRSTDKRQQRRAFLRFVSIASQSFHQVDIDLLTLCTELRSVGQPLRLISSMLS